MAQTMVVFQERMNDLALKRLEIIEHASVDVVQDIENFYREMAERIMKEDEVYNTQKLPQLMEILNSYEEGTGAYNLYFKRIDDDMAHHVYYIQQQMESVARRQEEVIRGFMDSKQKILEQTGSMTEKMLKEMLEGQMALNAGAAGKTEAVKAVEAADKKLLAEASGSK